MVLLGLLLAVPAFAYFLAPLFNRREEEGAGEGMVPVERVAELPFGEWKLVTLETVRQDGWKKSRVRHAIWVRRQANEPTPQVLSPICPHLGCPVNWHPGQDEEPGQFVCPCHKGVFNAEGQHVSGPPPRSMDPLEAEVRGSRLWVRWQDFKIGTPKRIPVSG
jgi:menaquinol-cytochrome c reductase iron-sulfur subunit